MSHSISNTSSILRRKQVQEHTGLSRSSIYKLMKERKFPQAVSISERSIGWRRGDIDRWLEERPTKSYQAELPLTS
jgi:prophage regulatory protein